MNDVKLIATLSAALQEIAFYEPEEPVDEWAEAKAFKTVKEIAKKAIAKAEALA